MSEQDKPAFTPGPWRWEVNRKGKQITLCGGTPTFDKTVMAFKRWGMSGATPLFLTCTDGMHRIVPADNFAVIAPGREHHLSWFQLLNHPDANLISAAPDLYAACKIFLAQCRCVDIHHHGFGAAFDAACAAIAKAEGRT